MEEIILRFGHIAEQIFGELENVSLTNCRDGCRLWKSDIDHEKIPQFRIIKMKTNISSTYLL